MQFTPNEIKDDSATVGESSPDKGELCDSKFCKRVDELMESSEIGETDAIDAIDVAGHHINKGISLGKYAYNKQKYSNPYSFTASKVAEHAVSPFVKSVSKKMGPSTSDSMKSAVHGMFNTEGIRPNQVSLAAERSSRGVPQSEKTPIVVQSTMSSSV